MQRAALIGSATREEARLRRDGLLSSWLAEDPTGQATATDSPDIIADAENAVGDGLPGHDAGYPARRNRK
jgi:hypothetical protein